MVWVPYTTTNGQWIVSKILPGFFEALIESLCEISVTDVVRFVTSQGRNAFPVLMQVYGVLHTRARYLPSHIHSFSSWQ